MNLDTPHHVINELKMQLLAPCKSGFHVVQYEYIHFGVCVFLPVHEWDLLEQLLHGGLLQLGRVEQRGLGPGGREPDHDAYEENGTEDDQEAPVLAAKLQTWRRMEMRHFSISLV